MMSGWGMRFSQKVSKLILSVYMGYNDSSSIYNTEGVCVTLKLGLGLGLGLTVSGASELILKPGCMEGN